MSSMTVTVEHFDNNRRGEHYTGHRGLRVTADTGFDGNVFSSQFPDVYICDNGDVEIEECRVPADRAVKWLTALQHAIQAARQ